MLKTYLWYVSAHTRFIARGEHQQDAFSKLDKLQRAQAPFAEFCVELPPLVSPETPYLHLLNIRNAARARAEVSFNE